MAWRIQESLIKGEVDNRVRGRVTGRLWFTGRDEPVVLELAGNAWRDVAGHVLRFTNSAPRPPHADEFRGFATVQRGMVGDITASRKVKVPDCSMDEVMEFYKARKPFPWHWGNSLYLEWHGETNGRVVIESAGYTLELDPEAAWTMDETEELAQREANGRAMGEFMERLANAAEGAAYAIGDDDDTPTSEGEANADAEAARMDLLLDRVTARMEREELAPAELERVMDEERARLRRERGEPEPEPLTPEEEAERAEWIDQMNAAAEEALAEAESKKWKKDDDADANDGFSDDDWHPLVERCNALTHRLMAEPEERGWLTDDDAREHPLRELVDGVMIASGKLAGALGSKDEDEWPPEKLFAGSVLVRLKKARGHLRDALAGLDAADEQGLAEATWRTEVRAEAAGILGEVERLIVEVRGVLEGGEGEVEE